MKGCRHWVFEYSIQRKWSEMFWIRLLRCLQRKVQSSKSVLVRLHSHYSVTSLCTYSLPKISTANLKKLQARYKNQVQDADPTERTMSSFLDDPKFYEYKLRVLSNILLRREEKQRKQRRILGGVFL